MFSASKPENLKGFVGDEKAAQTKQSWPLGAAWQEVGGRGGQQNMGRGCHPSFLIKVNSYKCMSQLGGK